MMDVGFFDFGGVIAEEGFVKGFRAIALSQGLEPDVVLQAGVDAAWDTGFVLGLSEESAFWDFVRIRAGVKGEDAFLRQHLYNNFVVRPWMLEIVDKVRAAGVRPAILSDQLWWLDVINAKYGFFSRFDKVFNSYHHGVSKRQEAFFELAMKEMDVTPERSFFVDDHPGNVERANKLGMKAILYQDRASFEEALYALVPQAKESR